MTSKFKMGIMDNITRDALIVCVIVGLFAAIGIVDNILVFRTLFVYKRVRIGLFGLAAGLALADFMYLVIGVPVVILYETKNYEFLTEPFCKIEAYLTNTFGCIAAYHLVAFAVLRAIVLTSRSRRGPTFLQGVLCSLCLWGLALVANIPMLTAFNSDELHVCLLRFDYTFESFLLLVLAFTYAFPLVLIAFIYFVTYLICRRFVEDSFSLHQRRYSRLVSIVIAVYVFCWLPVNVLHLVIFYKGKNLEPETLTPQQYDAILDEFEVLYIVRDYFIGIAHLDKFIRPIIYANLSKDYGRSFDEVVNCQLCLKGRSETGSNSSSTAPLTSQCGEQPTEEIL